MRRWSAASTSSSWAPSTRHPLANTRWAASPSTLSALPPAMCGCGATLCENDPDMKRVCIMGCGRVGAALAADLARDGNDVTILDTDPSAFRFLPEDINVTQVVGNGIDLDVLRRYGVDRMDVFVSATRGDNRN